METFSNDYICLFEGIPDVILTFVFTKNIEGLSWKKHFELRFSDFKKIVLSVEPVHGNLFKLLYLSI